MSIREKLEELKTRLRRIPRLAVSFSGGVDSALLLKVAVDTLGSERVVAITAKGANFPDREFREAEELVRQLGVRHVLLDFDVMAVTGFVENSPERCYHCKKELFLAALDAAQREGADALADGANTDDEGDYRPGMRATAELGIVSPLREAGMGKADIRQLLKEFGMPDWNKPSLACLASRIPYGTAIAKEDMERVDRAECFLLGAGLRNVRVRHHGDLARIEVEAEDKRRFFEDAAFADGVVAALRDIGYKYVTLDLKGYRTGSMNEGL